MSTENLFSVLASRSYQSLALREPFGCPGLFASIHRAPLLQQWQPLDFTLRVAGTKGVALPDLCTVYARGVLAMRADVKEALFQNVALDAWWEFLPIVVEQERWWLLNCPGTVTFLGGEEEPEAMRAPNNRTMLTRNLTALDPRTSRQELFALARPSCAQLLFARPSFKSRVERLRLRGLEFQRVGMPVAQPA